MATRKEVMIKLVKKEAKKLKKLATKEELRRLNFRNLNGHSEIYCLYGQITGNCISERASELINKSCTRVYKRVECHPDKCPINGKPNGEIRGLGRVSYYSPIEVFIATKTNIENGNNEKLIKYLKGESNKFNFK